MRERLIGLVMLIAGGVLAYTCVYSPLEAAKNQEASISISLKGAILCPIALVFGLLYVGLGEHAKNVLGTRQEPHPAVWVLAVLMLAAGLGLYFWLKTTLESHGYNF